MTDITVKSVIHSKTPSIVIDQKYAHVRINNSKFIGIHSEVASGTVGIVTGTKLLIQNSMFR